MMGKKENSKKEKEEFRSLNVEYSELIIDLYKNPINSYVMKDFDIKVDAGNAFCGDQVTVFIKLSKDKKTVKEASYKAKGCAISNASASMLMQNIKDKKVDYVLSLTLKDLFSLLKADLYSRSKCVFLPLYAIQEGLKAFLTRKKDDKIVIKVHL